MVLPLAGEITRDDAMRKLREWVPQKREEWNISEVYTDARVLDEENALGLQRFVFTSR